LTSIFTNLPAKTILRQAFVRLKSVFNRTITKYHKKHILSSRFGTAAAWQKECAASNLPRARRGKTKKCEKRLAIF